MVFERIIQRDIEKGKGKKEKENERVDDDDCHGLQRNLLTQRFQHMNFPKCIRIFLDLFSFFNGQLKLLLIPMEGVIVVPFDACFQ